MKHNVGVIGLGFVGTAVETGFQDITNMTVHDKYKDSSSFLSTVHNSDIIFLCLPTPMDPDTGACDTSIVEEVVDDINRVANVRKTLIIKSTVQPGTTARLAEEYPDHDFVFNPEYLTEANFVDDFLNQDRIVIGYTKGRIEAVEDLMTAFTRTQKTPATIHLRDSSVAEMAKYIANCFLATKVIFFNEIKQICDRANIDFKKATDVALLDTRIGKTHTQVPGPDGYHGTGGACFSKDLNALTFFAEELGLDPLLLHSVWTKNLLVREVYDWETLAQVNGQYKKQ